MSDTPPYQPLPARVAWTHIVLAAALMLATLPGRTQGLGLITEPMQADLGLSDITYAQITLWATLLGSLASFPAGWLIDRHGLRGPTVVTLVLLAATVWTLTTVSAGLIAIFTLMLLTRSLGQSALSVASITTANRGAGSSHMAMAVYAILLSVFMGAAFPGVGALVRGSGWRVAWSAVAAGVLAIAAVSFFVLPRGPSFRKKETATLPGMSSTDAMRTPVFWIFGGSIALFGLVNSGVSLFNEALLAERGFDRTSYHNVFLPVMALTALAGQFLCGWVSRRWSLSRLLALSLFLHAAALATVPHLSTLPQMSFFASVFGLSSGIITVVFFAVWPVAFGQAQIGRIQGAAQAFSVFASAFGPLVFAATHAWWHSYTPVLLALSAAMFIAAAVAWFLKMRPFTPEP